MIQSDLIFGSCINLCQLFSQLNLSQTPTDQKLSGKILIAGATITKRHILFSNIVTLS
jgi:hypothetical protein